MKMKTYIAYKFAGNDVSRLKHDLKVLSERIEECGMETYIFMRNVRNWGEIEMSPKEIIYRDFKDLKELDVFFAFVDSEEKSEGMLLEAGYAKANNLKMVLAIKKNIDLRLLRALSDEIIEFETFDDLIMQIPKVLNPKVL